MDSLNKQIAVSNNNDYEAKAVVSRVLRRLDEERDEKRAFNGVLDGLNDDAVHNLCIEICGHESFCKFRG
jgi:hypothetical protein